MNKTLWAPWRMDYILGPKSGKCVFCEACEGTEERREENMVLAACPEAFVIMNRYPYTHGHIMVVPARHVSNLEDMTPKEQSVFFELVVKAQTALKEALKPGGLNLGMNLGKAAGAGIEDHLHIHIVPRWDGDTNFMPLLADARVMPEHMDETYRTLVPFFEKLDDHQK